MRFFLIMAMLLHISIFSFAQDRLNYSKQQRVQLDSLNSLLHQASNDTLLMDVYRGLGFYYAELNRDSSLYFGKKYLILTKKLRQPFWEVSALTHICYVNYKMANYPMALKIAIQALKIAEDPAIEKNIWGLSKKESPQKARIQLLSGVLLNLGLLYGATDNKAKQLAIFQKILKYGEKTGNEIIMNVINMNLGSLYLKLGKLDSALACEEKALHYSNLSGYTKYKGGILYNFGLIYFKKEKYELANQYFKKSINIALEQKNNVQQGDSYIAISDVFRKINELDSSTIYANKGLAILKKMNSADGILKGYRSKYETYQNLNNQDSTYKYLQLVLTLSDSLNKIEKEKLKQFLNVGFDEQLRLEELERENIQNRNRFRTYALLSGLSVLLIVGLLLYRNIRQKSLINRVLQHKNQEIEHTLIKLKSTQTQLIQKEKMASLGELTAGIAHEIQNPLNFVNNYSEVNVELIEEMDDEMDKGNYAEAKELLTDLRDNESKIHHHGRRADAIVRGMLEHARSTPGERQPTDFNRLADEYLRLAYQGMRAKDKDFQCELITDFDADIGEVKLVAPDIGRVLLNLYNNAFYAVRQKQMVAADQAYMPTVWVSTTKLPLRSDGRLEGESRGEIVEIKVRDNGPGIPEAIQPKIFQPFFTTKPTGEGTGLGLSLSYDIVTKGHAGSLSVASEDGLGTEFRVELPFFQG